MSDINPDADRTSADAAGAASGAPSGAPSRAASRARSDAPSGQGPPPPSATLAALQELVDVAGTVPGVVAHRAGLSTSELHALRHLMTGPMGPVELARALGVTSAASSGIVDRLASRGHVVRRPHSEDGRRTQVLMTPEGAAEVLALMAPMFSRLAALDVGLSDDERAVVERFLHGATAAMRSLTAG